MSVAKIIENVKMIFKKCNRVQFFKIKNYFQKLKPGNSARMWVFRQRNEVYIVNERVITQYAESKCQDE